MKSSAPPAGDQTQHPRPTRVPPLTVDKMSMWFPAENDGPDKRSCVQMTQDDKPNHDPPTRFTSAKVQTRVNISILESFPLFVYSEICC